MFKVTGHHSTYDFTGVTINFDTDLLKAFGREDVHQVQILGNYNVLKNLKMVDVGSRTDRPTWRATNVVLDGSYNRIEGFHMTVKGSWPYGYGDAFGKGGNYVIKHFKHCAILIRGESNHVKACTMMHMAYGHAIYMQAANNALIEDCYVEGEIRSTDDMLAERGSGSPADKVDFKTVWGYPLPAGFMMSLQEGGIRAYNGGHTVIDGKAYERGTTHVTVVNCTIKNMRTGITLTHAKGKKLVRGSTTIGCERGFCIGSGDIINCRGDARYGPVFGIDYESNRNCRAEITILSNDDSYNGNSQLTYIIGNGHYITFRGSDNGSNQALTIDIAGQYDVVRSRDAPVKAASHVEIHNLTTYPLRMGGNSSDTFGESCGVIINQGLITMSTELIATKPINNWGFVITVLSRKLIFL
ncbi:MULTISPECIES: right-handed parallel beta-helix repeat-containing protein [unclassified Lentimonas]|uniref:right-handed parallel beta-helix repeat-containing protein n=1 Tax=unclassified Lentimonas TaxID=2630993 RepID=UPI00132B0473|nr:MULTISPECIES: right-handed parallel beta-helix repeat-containing protein [unclassified Lentimonas]CAA6689884.1 Unannotated [Lentimonas sp. CC10]CAA6697145.1 Unannotated [Lentimonas sp. CC19]CAA7069419.1 Unannotated [Lentimonas sp. CC11]